MATSSRQRSVKSVSHSTSSRRSQQSSQVRHQSQQPSQVRHQSPVSHQSGASGIRQGGGTSESRGAQGALKPQDRIHLSEETGNAAEQKGAANPDKDISAKESASSNVSGIISGIREMQNGAQDGASKEKADAVGAAKGAADAPGASKGTADPGASKESADAGNPKENAKIDEAKGAAEKMKAEELKGAPEAGAAEKSAASDQAEGSKLSPEKSKMLSSQLKSLNGFLDMLDQNRNRLSPGQYKATLEQVSSILDQMSCIASGKPYNPDDYMKRWGNLITSWRQGREGNCASVAVIKAAMHKWGNKVFADQKLASDGGFDVRMRDGKQIHVSPQELAAARRMSHFVGRDSKAFDYANLVYASMAKRALLERHEGARTFSQACHSLNNGEMPSYPAISWESTTGFIS